MKPLKFKNVMGSFLTAALVSISPATHAEWIGKGKEVDYFGAELSVQPRIGLLEDTHPVTHDFTGKALYFNFEVLYPNRPGATVIRFNSDKSMTYWSTATPEKSYTSSYVVLKIAENIYFLNWAEDTAYGLPWVGVWPAAIVVDLNKMVATDAYVSPTRVGEHAKDGKPQYHLTQLRIAFEDIAKAKDDKRYVPQGLLAKK